MFAHGVIIANIDLRYLFGLIWIVRAKTAQKNEAIRLRKNGLSYSEIQKYIPVSQSSLSLWLKGMELSKKQKERLAKKGDKARKLGSIALKNDRLERSKAVIDKAKSEIGNLNLNDLMLIGTTLYWAEGSKQKEHCPSKQVIFSNSDPKMIKVYLRWLDKCLQIPSERIVFEIYIHKSHKKSIKELVDYWSEVTGFPESKFTKVYFKKNKIHSLRKNRGADYSGVLRISVTKSTDLNRKIIGWVDGIYSEWSSLTK